MLYTCTNNIVLIFIFTGTSSIYESFVSENTVLDCLY